MIVFRIVIRIVFPPDPNITIYGNKDNRKGILKSESRRPK
jgi:hypothetical protein